MQPHAELIPWFTKYVVPVIDGYWASDLQQARKAHDRALAALDELPDPDSRKASWLRLTVPWVMALMEHGAPEEGQQALSELMLAWSGEQPGPLSTEVARITELMARLHLDAMNWLPLHAEEARKLMAAVPDDHRGGNFWSAVSLWAFKHGRTAELEKAMVYVSGHSTPRMYDWLYYRTLLMYRLCEGIALGSDLEQVAGLVENKPQLRELESFIMPACRKQGIITPRARRTLKEKSRQLAA